MKILVTGANGLLGRHLVKKLLDSKYQVFATGKGRSKLPLNGEAKFEFRSLDITDGAAVNKLVNEIKPTVILHAAAMTQVDECELKKVDCWNTNVTATRFIIDAARETGSRIIFISTDFVFDGLHGPYKEEDEPNPVNYYGSTKLAAEKAIEQSGLDWAIVRTVLVVGSSADGQRQNILTWVKEKLEKGETIKVVDDQVRTPTYVEDLADGILLILEKNKKGIFHIAGKDTLTPYKIATQTADFLHLNANLIEKVDANNFTQAALRPPKTGFIIEKAKKELDYDPHSFTEILPSVFGDRYRRIAPPGQGSNRER
ncbi:MAG TPA: SDR family oxidoreductase [Chitinophagaceae bacterium]|nr:SDR family oxidoreductase [Chitinophagaceae bacterium]